MKRLLIFIVLLLSGVSFGQTNPSTCARNNNCSWTGKNSFKEINKQQNATYYSDIQAAINAQVAAYKGGPVYLPANTLFNNLNQIQWKRGTHIFCGGTGALATDSGAVEIRQPLGANQDFIVTDPAIPTTDDQHWAWMDGCTVRGTVGNTSGSGLALNSRSGELFRVSRSFFMDFPKSGIEFKHGTEPLYLEQLNLTRNGEYGIDLCKTGSDPWAKVHVNDISGDDNGLGLVHVCLGSGSDSNQANDSFLFTGIKSETDTTGKQPNVFVFDAMNRSVVSVHGLSAFAHVNGNAIFRMNGTSQAPVLAASAVAPDCSHFSYLVDDQSSTTGSAHNVQIPCQSVGSMLYQWPDRANVNNVFMYSTGAGAAETAGATFKRFGDAGYRVSIGDFIVLGDGTVKTHNNTNLDTRIRRSGSGGVVMDKPDGTLATLRIGVITAGTSAIPITNAAGKLDATQLTGQVPVASLASGTPTGAKFLRDDATWQTITPATLSCTPTVNAGTVTGNGAVQALFSCSVPSIPAGKCIRAVAHANGTLTTASKTFSWTFGAATVNYAASTTAASNISATAIICNTAGSTTAQIISLHPMIVGASLLGSGVGNGTENTTGAVTLSLNMNGPGTESLAVKTAIVELLQ